MTTLIAGSSTTRLERRKARTRASILSAAEQLFGSRGYDDTSIAQIAETADTGVGTVYGYFASKAEILQAVLRDHSRA
ncbi:MAG: helix-turn-helix transcriptional regulator, partial [Dehalococcoidia bacterium]|nr:helix-turn-helix transcriptional regulator [Dehalococcoidia bacterium]